MNIVTDAAVKMRPDILTSGGHYFNFLKPETCTITIADIANALSLINRFGGHTLWPYTVAQHSVLVSHLVPPEDMLAALLHDAHEAYIGDVPSPLKQLLPDYQALEKRIEREVLSRFGFTLPLPPSVKHADLVMLNTEQHYLMPPHDDEWAHIRDIGRAPFPIMPWSADKAREEFIYRFGKLTNGITDGEVPK